MKYKKSIIFFSMLFAIFIVPGALADSSCLDCHEKLSAFNETEKLFNEIRVKHLARDVSCSLDCHAATLDKFAKSNYEQWTRSKHAQFNVSCNSCHSGNPGSDIKDEAHTGVRRSSDPDSTVFYRNVPETCGECHVNELKQFSASKHYQRLKALKQAPTCDTCHVPHEFKVLNVRETHGMCSNCHNPDMRIAPLDAPDRAIVSLESAERLNDEIKKAMDAIKFAKQQGEDVSEAQKDLENAESIRDQLPVLWHSFDLAQFESVTDSGIKAARRAQMDSDTPAATPSAPGAGAMLSLAGIIAIYLLLRRGRG